MARRCTVCKHPERHHIEHLRLAGVAVDRIVEKYSDLSRDSIYRHMAGCVRPEVKAQIIADVPLSELAERAAKEGHSVLDYLKIIRQRVMTSLMASGSVNDHSGTSALAKRALEVNREIGRLTGEIVAAAAGTSITNNVVLMQSPAVLKLERMLVERLAPHPEALRAVLAGLAELEGTEAPPTIEMAALEPPCAA